MWDKMATCWAGEEDWMTARKQQNSPEDRYKFLTYILNKMKLPTEHRKTGKKDEKKKRFKKKTPRDLGPEDITVHTREGGPAVQLCGDSNVACTWTMENLPKEPSTKTIGKIQRILHSWWKRGAATPISNITTSLNTSTENITRKQITGPTWSHREGGNLRSTRKT